MTARRIVALVPAALAAVVALALTVALPVAQVPTAQAERGCCCRRDAACHCPDHGPPSSSLRACGGEAHRIAMPSLIAIAAPPLAVIPTVPVERPAVRVPLAAPRPAPWPPRPAAPS